VNTVWTLEHLLKDTDDLAAYVQLPDEVFADEPDVTAVREEDRRLGDRGMAMIDTADPLCLAAGLFAMEDYTVIALTEPALFHRLLEKLSRYLLAWTQKVAAALPGYLWRICGPEYAMPPFLPPRLFEEYVVRYTGPMVTAIGHHGGFARLHSHGNIRRALPQIVAMGCAATDPIEPPPRGDITLGEVRREYGKDLALFGNLEIADIENLPPARFEEVVARTIAEGTAGPGRGFVLMPTAAPYGRQIAATTMANYETMVRLVNAG
jgi:uroporphyrinogen-III decarboxylase